MHLRAIVGPLEYNTLEISVITAGIGLLLSGKGLGSRMVSSITRELSMITRLRIASRRGLCPLERPPSVKYSMSVLLHCVVCIVLDAARLLR